MVKQTTNRYLTPWLTLALLFVSQCFAAFASGQRVELAGMITELKVGRGQVEIKPAGAQDWRRAGPLMALRASDEIRSTDDASAVILLSSGRGSVKVVAGSSPFVVPAPQAGEAKVQKVMTFLDAILSFLLNTAKEVKHAPASTRDGPKLPVILSPRNGPVLPDSLTFEWLESPFARHAIRILGSQGVVLEKKDLTAAKFDYPSDVPPLTSGVRYTFELLSAKHPAQQTWFEVLDPTRAQAIRLDLEELDQAVGRTVPPNTFVALRAALLASNGLLHDARLLLIGALAKDPNEPTLHLLLGNLYDKAGLPVQAAESYNEARFLLSGQTKR